jgi:hypothetical protein
VDERLHIEAVRLFIENCKFRKALNEVDMNPVSAGACTFASGRV